LISGTHFFMEGKYVHSYKDGNITCPYCVHSSDIIYVHGHAQCVCCNTIIEPCCDGENNHEEESKEGREVQ